jgi:nucleoid DNA-binding protein
MAKPANKTKATDSDVAAFIGAVADPAQRADAETICAMMTRISGELAKMWGPSIIGFGKYQYRYENGREGEMCRIGFSPRNGQTVFYLVEGYEGKADQLQRLGKHKTGKACLYIKRLSDVRVEVLEEMVAESLAYMDQKYPK